MIDTTPPVITNVMVSTSIAPLGSQISISAKVFDTRTWHTCIFTESGTYSIGIRATDTGGNKALAKGPEIGTT